MSEQNLKDKTKKGLYWSFFNQFSTNGIQLIIGIVMARLLSPSDYGITAIPAVFMSIAGVFVGGGFSDALIRKTELKEEDLCTAFYYSIAVGWTCYLILFFSSPWIADFYNTPVMRSLMRVTALTFLFSPLNTPQNVLMSRKLDFKTPAKIAIVCQISSGIIGIFLAFYGYGLWALVFSGLFSNIIGLLLRWYAVKWLPRKGWSKESFRYLWDYGNKMMGSALLDTIFRNISPVFIGKYYSTNDLGVYNRAQNYAALPSQQFSGVILSVSFPVISKVKDDDEILERTYRKMLRVTAFIVFPIMMLLAGLARPLVLIMVTAKWESCVYLLQIICFSMMWYPIHAINLSLLRAKGRSDLFFKLEIYKKIVSLVLIIVTLPFGIVTFCYGNILGSFIALFINTYYTGTLIHCGFKEQMKDIIPILIISIITFIISVSFTNIFDNLWVQLIIGGTIGVFFYLGISWIFRFQELKESIYLLKVGSKKSDF